MPSELQSGRCDLSVIVDKGSVKRDALVPNTNNVNYFGYTGQIWFKELGLFHYKARMYAPKLGRFLQTDPIFYADQMNMYAYVGNDPVNKIDPTGMMQCASLPGVGNYSCTMTPSDGEKAAKNEIANAKTSLKTTAAVAVGVGTTLVAPEVTVAKLAAMGLRGASLTKRANTVHDALDPIAASRRTTAALDTKDGSRIIASGGRDLSPAQRAVLEPGEIAAKLPGAHAEVTALQHAQAAGLSPSELVTTRTICPECAAYIESLGGRLTSSTSAAW